jgi:hypothetical protein
MVPEKEDLLICSNQLTLLWKIASSDNSTNPRVGHQIAKKQGFYYF